MNGGNVGRSLVLSIGSLLFAIVSSEKSCLCQSMTLRSLYRTHNEASVVCLCLSMIVYHDEPIALSRSEKVISLYG